MFAILLFLIIGSTISTPFQDPADQAFDEIWSQLGPGLERYYSGDPVGYAEMYIEDGTYWSGLRIVRGKDNLIEYFNAFAGKTVFPDFKMSEVTKQLLGEEMVLMYTIDEGNGTYWRATEVWRKSGTWRMVHSQWTATEPDKISLKWTHIAMIVGASVLIGLFSGMILFRKKKGV